MQQIYWELIGLGVDAGLAWILWKCYNNGLKHVREILDAKKCEINPELVEYLKSCPDQAIPYVSVEGLSGTDSTPLTSHHKQREQGLIQHCTIIEHRSKRTQGVWCDITKTLRDSTDTVPFFLKSLTNDVRVHVEEPLNAEFLLDELKITYDHFEPSKSNALQKGIDRLFGDVSRGVQEREKMLGLGLQLLGLGKLVFEEGKVKLIPPDSGHFIITKSTLKEVMRKMTSKARVFKILAYILGGAGLSYALYMLYRTLNRMKERWEYQKILREMQEARRNSEEEGNDDGQNCVVCLSNPRETVLVDCGHIAVCLDCANALPEPKLCPICRGHIRRVVPMYHP